MQTIAFLGLGAMGAPMARRLLAAGHPLTVWNRSPQRADPLVAEGARRAADPADAVAGADLVITMLADPAAVRDVVTAMTPGLRAGTRVVDASTIGPDAVAGIAALLPPGVDLVDAPVMGSVDRAAAGTLLVLAGGDTEPVADVLEVFGSVTHCGPQGSGSALKLVMISAVISGVAVIGESLALADSLGLPEELTTHALAQGPLAGVTQRVLSTDASFRLALAAKDLDLAASAARMPLARAVRDRILAGEAPEADLSHLARLIRDDNKE